MRKVLRITLRVVFWLWMSSILLVVLYRFVPVPATVLMVQRWVETGKWQYRWTSLDKMNPQMVLAVIGAEDQRFFEHRGFDLEAIRKAVKHNRRGKRIRGASTISQQTAKNVFLWPGRTWVRKGLEVYFTVLIEFVWGKERILEVYLNIAEMGDGIYGVGAASRAHFGKSPDRLSNDQCCRLAAVLPNPRKYNARNPGPYVARRSAWICRQTYQLGGKKMLSDNGIHSR